MASAIAAMVAGTALAVMPEVPLKAADSPVAGSMWSTGFEDGLAEVQPRYWDYRPTAPAVVSSPVKSGSRAVAFTVPSGGTRSEVSANDAGVTAKKFSQFVENDDRWFSFSSRLSSGVPLNSSRWQVVAQWKNNGGGSPPLQLAVQNGKYQFGGGYGHPSGSKLAMKTLGNASADTWENWTIHVKFSSNATTGFVEVWRNGSQVLTPWYPPGGTLYPKMWSYLKLGYYRSGAITGSGTVYHDDWKVGTTRGSVGG